MNPAIDKKQGIQQILQERCPWRQQQRMKNKKCSLIQGYNSIEANDDVIKLLIGLKELTFKMHKVQYGYWTICQGQCGESSQ
jgi:hypothetical protein